MRIAYGSIAIFGWQRRVITSNFPVGGYALTTRTCFQCGRHAGHLPYRQQHAM